MEFLLAPAKLVVASTFVCLFAIPILLLMVVWQYVDPVDHRY